MKSAKAISDRNLPAIVVAIDIGKSKWHVGGFSLAGALLDDELISTSTPSQTFAETVHYISNQLSAYRVVRFGLSIFGPLQINSSHSDYGSIVGSSEASWSGINLPRSLHDRYGMPVYFDYDVNAGTLAEFWSQQLPSNSKFVYLSVGTGMGAVYCNGDTSFTGTETPQYGHTYVPKEADDKFSGNCVFHGPCLQGLASGKAVNERWNISPLDLPSDHPAWDLEARYIARACTNLTYSYAPDFILIGSGISSVPGIIEKSNQYFRKYVNRFPQTQANSIYAGSFIRKSSYAPLSSFFGAGLLARKKLGLRYGQR